MMKVVVCAAVIRLVFGLSPGPYRRLLRPQPSSTSGVITVQERGVDIEVGDTFFRSESLLSRDLSVLAAALYKREHGRLRVLDAFSGVGSRGSRYLAQAGADFVHCNDANEHVMDILNRNLQRHARANSSHLVTHGDGHRVIMDYWMRKDYLDVVDVDCFGLGTQAIVAALHAVRLPSGLIYVTSTDGRTSSGKSPLTSLASCGVWALPRSFNNDGANEQGLRLLLGQAALEASKLNLQVSPVFSLYSPHGPVYRAMLSVEPCCKDRGGAHAGKEALEKSVRFVAQCELCGQSAEVPWSELGAPSPGCGCRSRQGHDITEAGAPCVEEEEGTPSSVKPDIVKPEGGDKEHSQRPPVLTTASKLSPGRRQKKKKKKVVMKGSAATAAAAVRVTGPLWVGPLHDGEAMGGMGELAEEWGWGNDVTSLLGVLAQEVHDDLPPFSLDLHSLSR